MFFFFFYRPAAVESALAELKSLKAEHESLQKENRSIREKLQTALSDYTNLQAEAVTFVLTLLSRSSSSCFSQGELCEE